jgi:hypothetical protein
MGLRQWKARLRGLWRHVVLVWVVPILVVVLLSFVVAAR